MASFKSVFRFRDEDGQIQYSEAGESQCHTGESLVGRAVETFAGKNPWIKTLCSVESDKGFREQTPLFLCVGLNYKQHAGEANMATGAYPTIFTKPPDALAGPFEDIPIHPSYASMDYEAELCVVLGKDCKNLGRSDDVSEYILGYTAGNYVSSRWWQMPERSNNQHAVAKSFDKFAPIGPLIMSTDVIPDPARLRRECFVNGDKRQSPLIEDQILDIPTVILHLSRGATLRKGMVIMMGMPSGVAAFMTPLAWLKSGDIMEVKIDKIGAIKNVMRFEGSG
ncbi:fumarylacetoacetate hydrolase family protein [Thozetella sp. PMI_491]|nr:fumarylacetoacetate hydrolase family protein [Thozetella sp. PMI_491]